MSKRSKAAAERSKIEAGKMRLAGASQEEIRQQLGGVRSTTWRWLKDVGEIDWNALRQEELGPARKAFVEQVIARADDVLSGRLPVDAANAWRGLMDQILRVIGLEGPKRIESKSTRININADPTTMGLYSRFLHECRNLMPEQMEEVFQFMRSLPRHDIDMSPPPRMALPASSKEQEDFVE